MSDSRGSQPEPERAKPELCHGPENGCQSLHPIAVSLPAMNRDLPQNESLDHLENWLPETFTEAGEDEGAEGLQKPGQPRQEDVKIFCSRSTESSSSGNEFNGLGSNGTSAHSLELNSSSDQNPSDPGRSSRSNSSSSEPLSWHRSHKKLMSVIREMKRFIPAEKFENCGKTSTLSTLNYALKCVRQIQNSNAFRVFGEHGASRASVGVYSIEELAAVTSEHTPKNTDTFVAVFSLLSGQMMHVSEQAASILNCKKKTLDSSRFVELLAPQDVGVFYTYINQSHLPLWNMEAQKASLYKYAQVKSFFCRIRGGKDQDQEKRYFPFRITPYSVSICTSDQNELETCCLALAEKIHSGYEAPRIPLEKRIFTTMHSPGCVFLEIDDRAVPLLGYLPQELTGTSILMHLHPEDRPLMVAVHRKVLKFAGQPPFEHSPIRFCTQNGDYVILDTSWSSFMNPWSRKVVFIIGRHKVRTSPLNEDVFAARSREMSRMDDEIRALQGQIHKLLLQPVHSNGSSGYGSLVSNGSCEHYISVASSSDSNGNCVEEMQKEPMTLQQVFVDVNRLKNVGQQLYIESHSKPLNNRAARAELRGGKKDAASGLPRTMWNGSGGDPPPASCSDLRSAHHILSYQQINCMDSIIRYLESCSFPALKRKCESSTNTSSSSSEDDKQGQPSQNEVQTLEDTSGLSSITSQPPVISKPEEAIEPQAPATVVGPPMTDLALTAKALSVVSVTSQCSYSSTIVHVPHPESEVTAIEEAPLQSEPLELPPATTPSVVPEEIKLVGLTKEILSAHTQKEEQDYVDRFRHKILLSPYRSYLQQGGTGSKQTPSQERGDFPSKESTPDSCKRNSKQGKWKRQRPLELSESNSYVRDGSSSKQQVTVEQSSCGPGEGPCPAPSGMAFPLHPYSVPLAPMGGDLALSSVVAAPVLPPCLPYCIQPAPAFPAPGGSSFMTVWLHTIPVCPLPPQSFFPAQQPCSSTSYPCTMMPPVPPSTMPSPTAPDPVEPASLPSTPLSEGEHQEVSGGQPPLFSNSRSSSPLQLNLLQEELPKPPQPPSSTQAETSTEIKCEKEGEDSGNQDGHSVSSELFDLLLLEDAQSGTGSAESGTGSAESVSLVSGSNSSGSHGTSGCATGSRNSSKYFASNDSSQVSKRGKTKQEEKGPATACHPARPAWTAAGYLPEPILMTYQVPKRIEEDVLKEDLEKLTAMENQQPWFTEGQKEELAEVHPWICTGTVPQEINTQGCISCDSRNASREAVLPMDGGIPEEDNEDLLPSLAPA